MAGKSVIPYFFRMSWFGFVVRTSANRIRRRNSVDRYLVNGDVLGCDMGEMNRNGYVKAGRY